MKAWRYLVVAAAMLWAANSVFAQGYGGVGYRHDVANAARCSIAAPQTRFDRVFVWNQIDHFVQGVLDFRELSFLSSDLPDQVTKRRGTRLAD